MVDVGHHNLRRTPTAGSNLFSDGDNLLNVDGQSESDLLFFVDASEVRRVPLFRCPGDKTPYPVMTLLLSHSYSQGCSTAPFDRCDAYPSRLLLRYHRVPPTTRSAVVVRFPSSAACKEDRRASEAFRCRGRNKGGLFVESSTVGFNFSLMPDQPCGWDWFCWPQHLRRIVFRCCRGRSHVLRVPVPKFQLCHQQTFRVGYPCEHSRKVGLQFCRTGQAPWHFSTLRTVLFTAVARLGQRARATHVISALSLQQALQLSLCSV